MRVAEALAELSWREESVKFDWGSGITTEAAASPNSSLCYLLLELANSSLLPTISEHRSLERLGKVGEKSKDFRV